MRKIIDHEADVDSVSSPVTNESESLARELDLQAFKAALAIAVLFAVFLFASKGTETRRSVQAKPNSLSVAQIQEQAAPLAVSASIRIMDPRKIGKSVAEDSVLMKFTVTVL